MDLSINFVFFKLFFIFFVIIFKLSFWKFARDLQNIQTQTQNSNTQILKKLKTQTQT